MPIRMKPEITVFFPAYNEEENIRIAIDNAISVLRETAKSYEILIIVYRGSIDNTIKIVKELMKKEKRIKLLIQPKNKKGVGYAIKMGFEAAKYDLIFYSDADNQFNLNEFKKFLPYTKDYDIIAGYRINRQDPFMRLLTSKVYNIIVRIIFGVKEKDVDCAFRLVNKSIFKKIRLICNLGLGTTEILVKTRRAGFKIKQIGVHHYPRRAGSSVFESKGINLPKPKVVFDLLKEMAALWKELHK